MAGDLEDASSSDFLGHLGELVTHWLVDFLGPDTFDDLCQHTHLVFIDITVALGDVQQCAQLAHVQAAIIGKALNRAEGHFQIIPWFRHKHSLLQRLIR